jgi:hypothetical protein
MGRLMIRLLGFPIAAQVFWRNGMLARIAKYARTLDAYMAYVPAWPSRRYSLCTSLLTRDADTAPTNHHREQILVELMPRKDQLMILVRTELRGEQMSNLSWLVFAAIDSLVKEWYNIEVRSIVSIHV